MNLLQVSVLPHDIDIIDQILYLCVVIVDYNKVLALSL